MSKLLWSMVLMLAAPAAQAYIGPGMAAGTIAAIVGFVGALFLGLFAIIWYPIKRRLRRRAEQAAADNPDKPAASDT